MRRLILVTGTPRSGTTVVGQILGFARHTGTLHEPLNAQVGLKSVTRFYEFIEGEEADPGRLNAVVDGIRRLRLAYKPGGFPREAPWKRALKRVVGGRALASYRLCRLRPGLERIVWKDPFASFVAPLLAERYDMDVVVTVRDPFAMAASYKRMGWRFDVAPLADRLAACQPDAVAGLPARPDPGDPVGVGAALWHLTYRYLLTAMDRSRRIHLLDTDRLVERPIPVCRALYGALDLPWDTRVEQRIAGLYRERGGAAIPKQGVAHDHRRAVSSVNTYWTTILDHDEIARVEHLNGRLWAELQAACDEHGWHTPDPANERVPGTSRPSARSHAH